MERMKPFALTEPERRNSAVRRGYIWLCLAILGLSCSISLAYSPNSSEQDNQQSPEELVRLTVANEISADNKSGTKLMYLSHKWTPQGVETKLNVETTEATASLLIERNNHPISAQERQQEDARLDQLSHSPGDLRHKQRQEREDAQHTVRIIKALPYAFLYQFDGTEPGTASVGKAGDELIRLKLRPNPNYSPPSHVEQVLVGMQGSLLIDKNAHRIARIDARLFKDVSFGWGILGRLDRGGSFLVDQAEVSPGDWELTRTRLNFTGRIMLIKSLVIKSDERDSDFQVVPSNTTFAKGVELLKAEEAKMQKEHEPDRAAVNGNKR